MAKGQALCENNACMFLRDKWNNLFNSRDFPVSAEQFPDIVVKLTMQNVVSAKGAVLKERTIALDPSGR